MNIRNLIVLVLGLGTAAMVSAEIEVAPVVQSAAAGVYVVDATVQAVKQSVVSAQVPGRVLQLLVRAGDDGRAGHRPNR